MEIIPKPAQRLPLWQNILFYFSISLLLASGLTYFILGRFQKESASSLKSLKETLEREKTAEEKYLETRALTYQKKIKDFSGLIGQHRSSAGMFAILENLAHPKVQFTSLNLDMKEAKAAISGKTESFQTLDQQLRIFMGDKNIIKAELSDISMGERGGVGFSFTLFLNPSLLIFR